VKKTLVIANWKANIESLKEVTNFILEIKKKTQKNQEFILCAPFVFAAAIKSKGVTLGAQDVSNVTRGSHTGEVTAKMLKSVGVQYCIVGHSERRKRGETDQMVSEKVKNLLKGKITPILCIGEKIRGLNGEHFEEISNMLLSSLKDVPKASLASIVVTYEPVWAISTEKNGATDPETVREAIIFIKKVLTDHLGKKIASKVKVIYGGSVDPKNVREIKNVGTAEGFLIGKASLNPKSFLQISENLK